MQQSNADQEYKNLRGLTICLYPRVGHKSTITNLVTNVNKRHKGLTKNVSVQQTQTTTSFEAAKKKDEKITTNFQLLNERKI